MAKARNLTQEQMASALETDQGTISRIYNGGQGVTIEFAAKVAEVFGVRAGWVLFSEGQPSDDAARAYYEGRASALADAADVLSRLAVAQPDPATLQRLKRAIGGE